MARVLLYHCDVYDPARIRSIVTAGLDELNVRPRGRVLVKPNLTVAHPRFFKHTFTRSEFLDGLLGALAGRGEGITDLAVGEKSGVPIPTRGAFNWAGYPPVLRAHHARAVYFDEEPQGEVRLSHPDALRPMIIIPESVARCEFLVNAPKLKAHSMVTLTAALKNYIGLQDSAHQAIDHNQWLARKIVDLQEVVPQSFIAIDAITAGQRSEAAADPFPLNLILVATDPVAVDATCARILGVDPKGVEYIRLAAQRGYGKLEAGEIEIGGDVSLEEAQRRAHGFRMTLEPAAEYFRPRGNITVYSGPPPETAEYCAGGCPGMLISAVHSIEAFQPAVLDEMRPVSFIIGDYRGEIQDKPGERVMAMGDCAAWSGTLRGRSVEIHSVYKSTRRIDPRRARLGDPQYAIFGVLANLLRQVGKPVKVARGCPMLVTEAVHYVSLLGGTANPSFNLQVASAYAYYLTRRAVVRFWRRGVAPLLSFAFKRRSI